MSEARDKLILALFLILPFCVWFALVPINHVHIAQRYAFFLVAVVVLGWMTRNVWIRAFSIYVVIWQAALFSGIYSGVVSLQHAAGGMSEMLYLAAGLALFIGVSRTRIRLETFSLGIRLAAILQAAIGTLQILDLDVFNVILPQFMVIARGLPGDTMVGTLGNNNFLAAWLAISLPFFLDGKWRWFLPWLIGLLLWSHTTSAVLPAAVGIAVYLVHGRWEVSAPGARPVRWWVALFPLLAILCGAVYFLWDGAATNTRWQLWGFAGRQILESPAAIVFGLGPGAPWGPKYPMHNEWLTILHHYGIVGVAMVAGFLRGLDRSEGGLVAALAVIIINMLGNYPLHLAPSAFLIILIVGLMWRGKEV